VDLRVPVPGGPVAPGAIGAIGRTFHRRELACPPAICSFSSAQGRQLFKEALGAGTAEASFSLLEHFHTQEDPSFCGLGTLAMSLNALNIDPGRIWKGVWRWFNDDMLDCCEPLERVRQRGISLDRFCCLAKCNGAEVEMHRPTDPGEELESFRHRLIDAVSRVGGPVFVVAYSRKAFKQTGDGHYSPVAAYHEENDAALILDVARFKLPPHWVPVPLLWEALKYIDSASGLARGYVLLSRPQVPPSMPGDGLLSLALPDLHDLLLAVDGVRRSLVANDTPVQVLRALHKGLSGLSPLVRCSVDAEAKGSAALSELRGCTMGLLNQDCGAEAGDASCGNSCAGEALKSLVDMLVLPPTLWLPPELLMGSMARVLDIDRLPDALASEVIRLRTQISCELEKYSDQSAEARKP